MRIKGLLIPLTTVLLTFSNSPVKAQNDPSAFLKTVFSPDSLTGFDELKVSSEALSLGYYGIEYQAHMYYSKRNFINTKYNLEPGKEQEGIPDFISGSSNSGKYSTAVVNAAPCVNEGFESGTLAGWSASVGTNNNSQNYPNTPTPISMGSQVTVVTTPLVDGPTGFTIPNSPFGGNKVARINNTGANFAVVKLAQTFSVTQSNYLYEFAYWAIMQNAPSPVHTCTNTPYMLVKIRNFANTLQGCPNFSIVAPATGGCPGIGPTSWVSAAGGALMVNNAWQKFSIDLTPYMSQNVTIEVIVGACSLGGHYGYAYFDSNCNTMNLTVNNTQTLSMPGATVYPQVLCGTNATLSAPSGLNPYVWQGPPLSGVSNNTNQSITTSLAGNYTLNMSPTGICNPPIQKVIALSFVPPTTITASSYNLCGSGSNTVTTISAAGAAQYTWMPGGSNASSITVSPTITTIYTLTARTGTCVGDFTVQINVNPDPVLSVFSTHANLCPGETATLTASGANSYLWNPGNLTGSVVPVTQSSATIYTVVGTSTAGCVSTGTLAIGSNPPPNVVLLHFGASTICEGQSAVLVGINATSFTWNPGGLTSNPAVVSPTSTTTYTAIGASGTCTNSATITVVVDPGPSMTVTPSPTLVCPGMPSTLSVLAPSSLGFTWTPGGSNATSIVVTPTIAGGYSVTGVNALGCRSTRTINPNFSPTPTINITPASPTVCAGNSIQLTASGATTYTWNSPTTVGSQITVSPGANTSYTVVGSNGTCTNSAVTTVTVVSLPLVGASSSTSQICMGQSLTLSGSGATTYTWQPGGLVGQNAVVSPTSNTTYTVTGNNGGCQNTAMVSVTVNSGPALTPVVNPASICAGSSATLSSGGAVSYTWNPGNLPGSPVVVNPGVTTLYTVIGANALGCTSTGTVNLVVNPIPTITVSASSNSICMGSNVTLSASGATSYTWLPGNLTGASINPSPAGNTTYTVIGANAGGCTSQNTIAITVVALPVVTASASPTSVCPGNCATLTGGGATTYTWNPGGSTGTSVQMCPNSTTNYTVIGNSAGCTGSANVVVNVNSLPVITAAANPATICPGGSSTITPAGGLSYTISGGAFVVNPLVTTVYTVSGTNAPGCIGTTTVMVTVLPQPNITISPNSASICVGGSVSLTASGGIAYSWQPGNLAGTNITALPLATTVYTVTGTVAGGCTATATSTVFVSPAPVVNASASPSTICSGACSTLSASGAANYNYTWAPTGGFSSSAVVCPVATTIYTVTGSNGVCSVTRTVSVNVNSAPLITANANPNPVCVGNPVTLNAGGGNTYTWTPGPIVGQAVVVNPSSTTIYTVTGTALSGCTGTATVTAVVNPLPIVFAITNPTSICSGGTATLNGGGGSSYTWTPGNLSGSTVTVSPLVSTIYTMTASDGNCTNTTTLNIPVNPTPNVTITGGPLSICPGGSATLTANGAAFYSWSSGGSGNVIVVTPSITTTYSVVGITANGCSGFASITVTVNPAPNLVVSATSNSICQGANSTLTVSGATSYTWLPMNVNGASVLVSPSVTTTYTVIGSNGACTSSQQITIVVFPPFNVGVSASPANICAGNSSALTATGGATYTWQPGGQMSTVISVSPLVTTIYTVTSTNLSGCTSQATVQVQVSPTPVISVVNTGTTICMGSCVTLTATGATSYTWNTLTSGNTLSVCPTANTNYTVVGQIGNCFNFVVASVNVMNGPALTTTASPPSICPGGSATLSASGAVSYTWTPGNLPGSNIVVTPLASTIYTVRGANAQGCVNNLTTYTVGVTVNSTPTIGISATSTVLCAGQVALLNASGANSFTWYPGGIVGSVITVTPGTTTTYTAVGSIGSCTGSATQQIIVNPVPVISATASPPNICTGQATSLTASGASSFIWSLGSFTNNPLVIFPSTSDVYTVTGSNAFGCNGSATVSVNVQLLPVVSISGNTAVCSGSPVTLTGTGASNYTWMPGNHTTAVINVSPASPTIYTLTGSSGFGCTATAVQLVTVNPVPSVTINASSSVVCAGESVTLTAFGANSYSWNPGSLSGNLVVVTPPGNTVYTVTGTSNGCSGVNTLSVVVNQLPVISAFATPTNICSGGTTTLTASGATNYTWFPMGITGAVVTDSPSGPTNYSVVGVSPLGCKNTTAIPVMVSPTPTVSAISSHTAVCIGNSATLTAGGAVNYTWMPGSQTGPILVVTPGGTSSYTVYGNNGATCTGSTVITLSVNSLPIIGASANPTVVCAGDNVTLTGSGAVNYTWMPGNISGGVVTDKPLNTTLYTVIGEDMNGCSNSATVNVLVNPLPVVSAVASPTTLCDGGTATLTAMGAQSYTWFPINATGTTVTDTPSATIIYTIVGEDAIGCTGTQTVLVMVVPNPTISVTPLNSSVCIGSSATLTASGASNYTWLPSGNNSSVTVETPLVNSTYTVIGDNAGMCFTSFTVDVFVNPLPANVVANSSGTITCATPSVDLFGASTDTNVSYGWTGPLSYSSNVQNPTGISMWGDYTLTVTDNITGCSANAIVSIPTDNSIPSVTATTSGSITCAVPVVTLNAAHNTTNAAYSWAGPSGFSANLQSPTITVAGDYSITVTDQSSTCTGTAMITVLVHTVVTSTASITPATCTNGISNNDGTIEVFNFDVNDKYDLVSGSSYTGSATYATAALIPTTGVITNTLSNPTTTVAYTLRIFDAQGCIQDYVLILVPVDCSVRSLGVAKTVSTPTLNTNGSYDMVYTLKIVNYDTSKTKGMLTDVSITDNLVSTFPAPAQFSVTSAPVIVSGGNSLSINAGFNGASDIAITTASASSLNPADSAIIAFTVNVKNVAFFTPYYNSALGECLNSTSITVTDSSNVGTNPDPDGDLDPGNNNLPTPVTFTPNVSFGITKAGQFWKVDNETYGISYTVTVHNLGNDTLHNVVIKDSLLQNTIKHPATYAITSAPFVHGPGLVANSGFNGGSDINLVHPSLSSLSPGTAVSIVFAINVVPDTVTIISNSAFGSALAAVSATQKVSVSDVSNAGNNPDTNNNTICDEPEDNQPTVLILPSLNELFIPEGFSPNDDGINDLFVIKGLPRNSKNSLTIFNRWGNRVYYHENYGTGYLWDGRANIAGTLGQDKLPQGTYYFILEMEGSGKKPITGFIVLQY